MVYGCNDQILFTRSSLGIYFPGGPSLSYTPLDRMFSPGLSVLIRLRGQSLGWLICIRSCFGWDRLEVKARDFLEIVDESRDFRVLNRRFIDDDFHGEILEPVGRPAMMAVMRMAYVSEIANCFLVMYSHSIPDHIAEAVHLILLAHIDVLQEAQVLTVRCIWVVPSSLYPE